VGVEVSGTIETVEVDFNDRVKEGQVLTRLDTSMLHSQVLQAQAALAAARARVLKTRADVKQTGLKLGQLQQARKASGGRIPSQVEMDEAEAALARAKADEASSLAEVSKTQAELEFNQTNLSKAIIVSPINGIILNRRVEPGPQCGPALYPTPEQPARDEKEKSRHAWSPAPPAQKAGSNQKERGQPAEKSTADLDPEPGETRPRPRYHWCN